MGRLRGKSHGGRIGRRYAPHRRSSLYRFGKVHRHAAPYSVFQARDQVRNKSDHHGIPGKRPLRLLLLRNRRGRTPGRRRHPCESDWHRSDHHRGSKSHDDREIRSSRTIGAGPGKPELITQVARALSREVRSPTHRSLSLLSCERDPILAAGSERGEKLSYRSRANARSQKALPYYDRLRSLRFNQGREFFNYRITNSPITIDSVIVEALHQVANHRHSLSRDEARSVMSEILSGGATDAQIAALLVALHMKGETVEEIVGFAEAIRAAATPIQLARNSALDVSDTERDALVDTCGTGGDASGTFNISTATALTVAGAGVRVAKHGNRSVTSKCGSADVVEALGIRINLLPEQVAACLDRVGIAFLFAPSMHSAMKYVQPARRELRLRTVFNLLGPLTNPAHASAQLVGVYSDELVDKVAEALSMLGLRRALVVHGEDGLDEITISGLTRVAEVRDGQVWSYEVTPEEFGFRRAGLEAIAGGDAAENAQIIREVLEGKKSACRDVVLLNAAATLVAAGRANHLSEAVPLAAESIDAGVARRKLEELAEFTQRDGARETVNSTA